MKTRFAVAVAMSSLVLQLVLVFQLLVAVPAQAAVVCDSGSRTGSTLPILESECPIGEGVWGQKIPSAKEQSFWIQCGFVKSGSLRSAPTQLQKLVSQPVWLKPDVEGDRCLVGPYQSVENALRDLRALRSVPRFGDAFIRTIEQRLTTTAPQRVAKTQPSQHQVESQKAASTVTAVTHTPYMIAGQHGHQDCLCFF